MERLYRAGINSWNGLRAAARSDAAIRQELWALLFAVPLAMVIGINTMQSLLMIGAILLLLAVELLNTSIEKLADRLTREHDPEIGVVKDMGSAAVGVALIIAGLTWLVAIGERLLLNL